ncbi:MAG: S49 family peptidase [Chloroflexi bacterium]|nr:S49 family peptidase [Chloroflexota bacterium]MDA0242102.1 S49 family peptidase [Chloroflexota bacterium]
MNHNDNVQTSSPLQIVLLGIVALLILGAGLYLAPRWVPEPKIGVIRLNYDIFNLSAAEITQQLAYARTHDDIKAIVLIINSPGGSASYSEELFLDVLETRNNMPVVASVDLLAASGAYYMAVGADEIYAKPTSFVGSIGVISSFPSPVFIDEQYLTTGPYKLFGGTRDGAIRQVEIAKFTFLEAVQLGRGDRLTASLSELSRAEIYSGVQAERMGMIDGLLSTDAAIRRAAELAGLQDYEVVELYPLTFETEAETPYFNYQPAIIDTTKLWAPPRNLAPGLYYLHIEGTQ